MGVTQAETQPKEETKHLPVQVFQELDRRDENQILAEMRGEELKEFVYSIDVNGKSIVNLSYAGAKEVRRRQGHYSIRDVRVEQDEKEFRAIVIVKDLKNETEAVGAASAERTKPFAWTLSINKAERNGLMKLIPAKLMAGLIKEWLEQNRSGTLPAETRAKGTTVPSESPILSPQSPAPASPIQTKPVPAWKVPVTKDQATPQQITQGLKQYPLVKGLDSFGMVNVLGNEISIVPEHAIPTDNAPFGFLRGQVVEPMKHKHSLEVEIRKTGESLEVILIRGSLEQKQITELVSAVQWTFSTISKDPVKKK